MIVLIDNYDSFVHNLGRYLSRLGQPLRVVRNDAFSVEELGGWGVSAIVVSPGPCTPHEAGNSLEVIRRFGSSVPVLGICLGHQAIVAALGGAVVRAPRPVHGHRDLVYHDGQREFAGLPLPFGAGRYHSLVVNDATLPEEFEVSARTADGIVMGVRHRVWPLTGWQFHPESVLTEVGYPLLVNWLRTVGLDVHGRTPDLADEVHPDSAVREAMRFWDGP